MFRFKELYLAAEPLVQPFYAAVMPFSAFNFLFRFKEPYLAAVMPFSAFYF